jgi:hypothetical protein
MSIQCYIYVICMFASICCVKSFQRSNYKQCRASQCHPSLLKPSSTDTHPATSLFSHGKRYAEVLQFLKTAQPRPVRPHTPDSPEDLALIETIVKAADDRKAINTIVFDVRGVSDSADYFIVTEGNSKPQNQAIVTSVEVT